jgi:AraC-like DNA-binding protein
MSGDSKPVDAYSLCQPHPVDLRRALRLVFEEHIVALREDAGRLRIPPAPSGGQLRRGMHMHLKPELFLQIGGRSLFRCVGSEFILNSGECCLMPRATAHGERAMSAGGRRFANAVLMLHSSHLVLHVAHSGPGPAFLPQGVGGQVHLPWSEQDLSLERMLDEVVARHAAGTADGCEVAATLLLGVLTIIKERLGDNAAGGPVRLGRIDQCKALVRARLGDVDLSVPSLAATIGCSADYLSHQFHAATGQRLADYINRKRIGQAKELLQATALSISEVAWACGYNEATYFTRLFRGFEGMTPREWRLQQQGKRG